MKDPDMWDNNPKWSKMKMTTSPSFGDSPDKSFNWLWSYVLFACQAHFIDHIYQGVRFDIIIEYTNKLGMSSKCSRDGENK